MSEVAIDREVDRSKLSVSDEVAIEITAMNKWYGDFHVLRDISLTVNRGADRGLRPVRFRQVHPDPLHQRLEEHQKGTIVVDGIELSSDLKNIDKIRSEVGMCFQHFNLFPHLSVLDNCTLAPIWVRKEPRKEAEAGAMHYLERVKIADQAQKFPRPAFRWSAAACGHRTLALHEPAHHAVR